MITLHTIFERLGRQGTQVKEYIQRMMGKHRLSTSPLSVALYVSRHVNIARFRNVSFSTNT